MQLKELIKYCNNKEIPCQYFRRKFLLNERMNDYNFYLNRYISEIKRDGEFGIIVVLGDKEL